MGVYRCNQLPCRCQIRSHSCWKRGNAMNGAWMIGKLDCHWLGWTRRYCSIQLLDGHFSLSSQIEPHKSNSLWKTSKENRLLRIWKHTTKQSRQTKTVCVLEAWQCNMPKEIHLCATKYSHRTLSNAYLKAVHHSLPKWIAKLPLSRLSWINISNSTS